MSNIKAALITVLVISNTLLCCIPLFLFSALKLVLPAALRPPISRLLIHIAEIWVGNNSWMIDRFLKVQWRYQGDMDKLKSQRWYLVISNHQSWIDILVLQRSFRKRIPFLKFFLKQELIWVPLLGVAWWALDFPFMKRHSAAEIARNPKLRGQDLATTRRACEKFRNTPISVMNFVEGTRFTEPKARQQNSPYPGLLKPRAGGIALVLDSMGEMLDGIVDVTIRYPNGIISLWQFLKSSGVPIEVNVRLRELPHFPEQLGYEESQANQQAFRQWLDNVWQEKSALLQTDSNS